MSSRNRRDVSTLAGSTLAVLVLGAVSVKAISFLIFSNNNLSPIPGTSLIASSDLNSPCLSRHAANRFGFSRQYH